MSGPTPVEQAAADARELVRGLTPREREVLILICKGLKRREIGSMLGVSPKTVDVHRDHVHQKFEVNSASEAAVIAAKAGIV